MNKKNIIIFIISSLILLILICTLFIKDNNYSYPSFTICDNCTLHNATSDINVAYCINNPKPFDTVCFIFNKTAENNLWFNFTYRNGTQKDYQITDTTLHFKTNGCWYLTKEVTSICANYDPYRQMYKRNIPPLPVDFIIDRITFGNNINNTYVLESDK